MAANIRRRTSQPRFLRQLRCRPRSGSGKTKRGRSGRPAIRHLRRFHRRSSFLQYPLRRPGLGRPNGFARLLSGWGFWLLAGQVSFCSIRDPRRSIRHRSQVRYPRLFRFPHRCLLLNRSRRSQFQSPFRSQSPRRRLRSLFLCRSHRIRSLIRSRRNPSRRRRFPFPLRIRSRRRQNRFQLRSPSRRLPRRRPSTPDPRPASSTGRAFSTRTARL